MKRFKSFLSALAGNPSGVAMTEFAMALPVLMTVGLYGTETANFALINMRVSQVAMHLADNGSRIGDTSTLSNRKIYERDIDDLLIGSNIQAGSSINFYEHGRVIISSLEVDSTTGNQYIHWQRCLGKKVWASNYGKEGDGKGTAIVGMGPKGEEVQAMDDGAVIFVEVSYDYQPLISSKFLGAKTITTTSSFTVRDSRDLSQIYQRVPASPDPVAKCNTNTGISAVTT
jgi:hypothetical protein